jgi:glyoxylase-like metal-dependent hydrolase (beta-lactamase superfamily II)
MKRTDRRSFLQGSLGALAGAASGSLLAGRPTLARTGLPIQKLTERVTVIGGAPGNVVALSAGDSVLLVDSGSAAQAGAVKASLGSVPVRTLFNTHYHLDQTGGNELFGSGGATIHAHVITRQWLAADYYVPAQDRWVKALPAKAVPTETFRGKGELKAGAESIEYGYLLEAHTRGDIYVFFRDSNVLVAGDVASPERDPVLDWYAGGWIGGRADALEDLVKLANDDTRIVPAYGPVMTKAQLVAERDLMKLLYDRTTQATDHGRSAQDMLDEGLLKDVGRKFQDPYRFLYDVSKGNWAHYTNFGGNIV